MSEQEAKRQRVPDLLDAEVDPKRISEIVGVSERTVRNIRAAKKIGNGVERKEGSGGNGLKGNEAFLKSLEAKIKADPTASMRRLADEFDVDEITIRRAEYRKELCSCQCRDLSAVQECYESGRVWDPSKCMCRCPLSTLQECSSKHVFDFTNSCKCIPEESNEITLRKERSQDVPGSALLPSLELLIIGALLLGVLFFVILTCSLWRHVHRLKTRLRRSAEVLVPGGTILRGSHSGYPHHPPGSLMNGHAQPHGSPT
eukprot:maker-scaffold176_size284796-snap-gene-1.24 protein:Tk06862 transcript:maker-scaffold176_size284796-snap-gene-1.24-mRNA-1 annotation:"vascular endothelial growth factor a-a"